MQEKVNWAEIARMRGRELLEEVEQAEDNPKPVKTALYMIDGYAMEKMKAERDEYASDKQGHEHIGKYEHPSVLEYKRIDAQIKEVRDIFESYCELAIIRACLDRKINIIRAMISPEYIHWFNIKRSGGWELVLAVMGEDKEITDLQSRYKPYIGGDQCTLTSGLVTTTYCAHCHLPLPLGPPGPVWAAGGRRSRIELGLGWGSGPYTMGWMG